MIKLLMDKNNVFYHTGLTASLAYLIVAGDHETLFVDGRYIEVAKALETDKRKVHLLEGLASIKEFINKQGIEAMAIEDTTSIKTLEKLKMTLGIDLIPYDFEDYRSIKTKHEVERIKAACKVGDEIFNEIQKYIAPGMTEKEIAAEMTKMAIAAGCSGMSFEPIIASTPNSSKPHARATQKKIQNGDWIKMDFGVVYEGWCSDMTRNVVVGENNNEKMQEIFDIVLKAQKAAVAAAKAGMTCDELDAVARDIITEAGYGENYTHSLGHGLGIEVHEFPWVRKGGETVLKAGHVISIEPGIYLPGVGGVRIEDLILIKEGGCEILTETPKELVVIK